MNTSFLRRILNLDTLWLKKSVAVIGHRTYCLNAYKLGCDGLSGLDAVVSYITTRMRKQGDIKKDLLLIDNPVSGEVVKRFEKAGVKKIACTVKWADHFLNIQEQLTDSHHVYHHHLFRKQKQETKQIFNTIKVEEEILSSFGDISRLVILASGISDVENMSSHRYLVNRAVTRDGRGFNTLDKIDWLIALPQKLVLLKKHFDSNHSVIKLLTTFYKHQNGINITYEESNSIFYNNLKFKKSKKAYKNADVNNKRLILNIMNSDVHFMHFVPSFSALQQFELEEKIAFQTFVRAVNGHHRLIPFLEKLVPGCGIGLIELGYGMADEAYNIKGSELIKLFKDVKSLPEYEGSVLCDLLTVKDVVENNFDIHSVRWKRH